MNFVSMKNKRSRKTRVAFPRTSGDAPSNIQCRRGPRDSNSTKSSETTNIRYCPSSRRERKKLKEDVGKRHRSQQAMNSKQKEEFSTNVSLKTSSVSFFVSLDSNENSQLEVSVETVDDWMNLSFNQADETTVLSCSPVPKSECRTVSESSSIDSEDDFICFETSTDSEDEFICFETSSNSTEDETSSDSEEDLDSDDALDSPCDRNPVKSNRCASDGKDITFEDKDDTVFVDGNSMSFERVESPSEGKSPNKKKVRFVDDSHLATVHYIVAWNFAYRAARVSPWSNIALDCQRFKRRIQLLEPILNPVLNVEHRAKVWGTRMMTEE